MRCGGVFDNHRWLSIASDGYRKIPRPRRRLIGLRLEIPLPAYGTVNFIRTKRLEAAGRRN